MEESSCQTFQVDTKVSREWVVSEDKPLGTVHQEKMDGVGKYLAPLFNLPPRGAYSDAKQVVQQLNLSYTVCLHGQFLLSTQPCLGPLCRSHFSSEDYNVCI